jgi:hypothetical protein
MVRRKKTYKERLREAKRKHPPTRDYRGIKLKKNGKIKYT